jgi:formate hydrogenlyase subunit 4
MSEALGEFEKARTLRRWAWALFAASIPLAIAGGLLHGVGYAAYRGLFAWGESLFFTAVLTLFAASILGAFNKSKTLARARVAVFSAIVLLLFIAYYSIAGIG